VAFPSLLKTVIIQQLSSFKAKQLMQMNSQNTHFGMDLVKYLTFSMILFLLGIWGIFLNRKNILIMLMSIELMLLAVNMNFLVFSVYLDDMIGQVFALFILTVAAAESAIGLAILVITFRIRGSIAVEFINCMKG
jgi:NADH:ubiquinone oxidoreductase subunit K